MVSLNEIFCLDLAKKIGLQGFGSICHNSAGQHVCHWKSKHESLALWEAGGYQQKAGGSASSFSSLSRTSLAQPQLLASRVEGFHHQAAVRRLLCSLGNEIRQGMGGFGVSVSCSFPCAFHRAQHSSSQGLGWRKGQDPCTGR